MSVWSVIFCSNTTCWFWESEMVAKFQGSSGNTASEHVLASPRLLEECRGREELTTKQEDGGRLVDRLCLCPVVFPGECFFKARSGFCFLSQFFFFFKKEKTCLVCFQPAFRWTALRQTEPPTISRFLPSPTFLFIISSSLGVCSCTFVVFLKVIF